MKRRRTAFLEVNKCDNTWVPPHVDMEKIICDAKNSMGTSTRKSHLYIFKTEPYIDSIYIEFDINRKPVDIRRFSIHEGYTWDRESEQFFHENCIKECKCSYCGGQIDQIYKTYSALHPEWHIQRYLTKGVRILDHIYNCIVKNTAKELLYKAGLDELAAHIDNMDELDMLASKPSDLYGGLPTRVLKSLNCQDGAMLISTTEQIEFVKELDRKYADFFSGKLNNAQCKYLMFLIKGGLTLGETGRLFGARKPDLSKIDTNYQFLDFLRIEKRNMGYIERCKVIERMDPIYEDMYENKEYIRFIDYYMGFKHIRKEYDRKISQANRKRDKSWQERGDKYIIRYPQTINDICREAVYMKSCLFTYVEAMLHNDTTILFMRKANDVNIPFITIEVYNGALKQAFHRFNEHCSTEEAEWIREYCYRHNIRVDFTFGEENDELD